MLFPIKLFLKKTISLLFIMVILSFSGFAFSNDNTKINNERDIPVGWEPLKANQNKVSLFKKEIIFKNSTIPFQVNLDRLNLFTKEMEIVLEANNTKIKLNKLPSEITRSDSHTFSKKSDYRNDNIKVTLHSELEYDGFLKIDLTIQPTQKTTINSLEIRLFLENKFSDSFSKYSEYDFNKQKIKKKNGSGLGELTKNATKSFAFSPSIWIGNKGKGIEWISETNLDYYNTNAKNVHSIIKSKSETQFITKIIDQPTQIDHELKYSFALFFTPSRAKKKNWMKDYIVTGSNIEKAVKINSLRKNMNMLYMGSWVKTPSAYPGLPSPDKSELIKYKRDRELLKLNNIKYIPYSSLYILPSTLPEVIRHSKEWSSAPKRRGSSYWTRRLKTKKPVQPITLESKSLRDYLISKHIQSQKTYKHDGVYFDVSQFWELSLTRERFIKKLKKHNRKDLSKTLYFPMYSHREFIKRFWRESKALNKEFTIIHHSGSNTPKFSAAYSDILVIGESLHLNFINGRMRTIKNGMKRQFIQPSKYIPDYFTLPGYLRNSSIFSQNDGFSHALLPQVSKHNEKYLKKNDKKNIKWSRTAIAFMLKNSYLFWDARIKRTVLSQTLDKLNQYNYFNSERKISDCTYKASTINKHVDSCKIIVKGTSNLLFISNASDKNIKISLKKIQNNLNKDNILFIPARDFILREI